VLHWPDDVGDEFVQILTPLGRHHVQRGALGAEPQRDRAEPARHRDVIAAAQALDVTHIETLGVHAARRHQIETADIFTFDSERMMQP